MLEPELVELPFLLSSLLALEPEELELEELEELEELGLEVELEPELEELEELGLEVEELGLEVEELGLELEELGLELEELALELEDPFFLDFDLDFLPLGFLLPLAMSCFSPSRVN